jgi:hypothetical protein
MDIAADSIRASIADGGPAHRTMPVDISSVSLERQQDPRFIRTYRHAVAWMNGPQFDRNARISTCLHESAHAVYTRRAGFKPEFHGPGVEYDRDADVFRWHRASIEGLPWDSLASFKVWIGCRSAGHNASRAGVRSAVSFCRS